MTFRHDPVVISTLLSVIIHAALLLAVLQLPSMPLPVGEGLRVELLNALAAPGRADDIPVVQNISSPQTSAAVQAVPSDASPKSPRFDNEQEQETVLEQAQVVVKHADAVDGDRADGADAQTVASEADTRIAAMLELLHNAVSEHRRYPYIALRQQREGTARIGFVLHPDGRIDDTALLESSRSPALDHAALTAVEEISPFEPASQYLSQAHRFNIDVVFSLQ